VKDVKIGIKKSSTRTVPIFLVMTLALARSKDKEGPNQLNSPWPSCKWLQRGSKAGMIRKNFCLWAVHFSLLLCRGKGGKRGPDPIIFSTPIPANERTRGKSNPPQYSFPLFL
jgi:hypothetical protein